MTVCNINFFKKKIHLIVACDATGGIGKNKTMPWDFKKDLQMFRRLTVGGGKNAVVMGYETWLSLPKKPLQKRTNYVFTQKNADKINKNEAISCHSLSDFWEKIEKNKEIEDIFVIGGEQIFNLFLQHEKKRIGQIYMTKIPGDYDCDAFFPLNEKKNLKKVEELEKICDNGVELRPIMYRLA